jgi:hypothetical protein
MIRQSVSSGVKGSIKASRYWSLNESDRKRFLALTDYALAPICRASSALNQGRFPSLGAE